MDAMGCLDHKGSRKNRVYVPEVTVVQQAENLFDSTLSYVHLHIAKHTYKRKRTPLRVMVSGALLLKRYCSNNQVASATYYNEGVRFMCGDGVPLSPLPGQRPARIHTQLGRPKNRCVNNEAPRNEDEALTRTVLLNSCPRYFVDRSWMAL